MCCILCVCSFIIVSSIASFINKIFKETLNVYDGAYDGAPHPCVPDSGVGGDGRLFAKDIKQARTGPENRFEWR